MASQTEEHMLTILERGDRKIETIKSKVIMQVGLTRVGKSCIFNWALNRPMIGQGDQIQANYKTMNQDPSNARLGSQYTSVTLIPNSADIDNETTLIDMAGFGDTRNYIGVMGVSYFLKSVFEKAQEVKFLIVFNEHAFFDVTGSAIIRTFSGFFNMFKLDLLNKYPKIKQKLFESISFVITRSQQPHLHQAYLKKVISKISEPKFVAPNKQLLQELGSYMLACNRIHAFPKARPDQHPEKCDIFQRFSFLKWQYLKIHEVQQKINQTIVNIPFNTDFDGLPAEDKKSFTDCIQKRIETYTDFASILKILLGSFKDNWKQTVQNKLVSDLPDNFMDSVLCFKKVFQAIQNFLKESDKYSSQNLIDQQIKTEYARPNIVKSIRNVLNIYIVADQIGQQPNYQLNDEFFQKNMKRYSLLFQQLIECIKSFCTSANQQKLVLRLKFVLKRGFLQFSKFNSIDPSQTVQANQQIKDRCNNTIFNESAKNYLQSFIKIMNQPLMTRIFTTIPAIEEFQELFEKYQQLHARQIASLENKNDIQLQFNRHSINIGYVKADIHMKLNDRIRSGLNFLSVIKLLCKQGEIVSELDSNDDLQSKLVNISMMKLRVIDKLVSILVILDIRKYPDAKDLAVSLCKHVNQIDAACEVYDLQLKDYKNDYAKLALIYKNYAEYCIQWGRYSDAKILLQKKLRLQTVDFNERSQTINTIYSLVQDTARMIDEEKERIQKLHNRLQQKDDRLQELLDNIKQLLQINISPSLSTSFTSANKL